MLINTGSFAVNAEIAGEEGDIFVAVDLFPWLHVFVFLGFFSWQDVHNRNEDVMVMGKLTFSEPDGGKDSPKNDPTAIKTQLHPERQHK